MRKTSNVLLILSLSAAAVPIAAAVTTQTHFDTSIAAAKQAMMGDPSLALHAIAEAKRDAAKLPSPPQVQIATATAEWLEGEALTRLNKPDEALTVLQDALIRANPASRSKLIADILLARGSARAAVGQVAPALQDFQTSYRIHISSGDARSAAKALMSIGDIYSQAGDDARSLSYYNQVSEIYKGDASFSLATHNNVGETLSRLGRHAEAEDQFSAALRYARQLHSGSLQARILTNLAAAQLGRGELRHAQVSTDAALSAIGSSDEEGWRPFVWGVKAQIALRKGDLGSAERALQQTFGGVDIEVSPPPFRDFHEAAYQVYSKLGRLQPALDHLVALRRLDEEARKLTTSTSSALLAAQFDFANQNLRISRLKERQIRNEASFERTRARLYNTVLTILVCAGALVIALLIAAALMLRRSRNQLKTTNISLNEVNESLQKALRVKTEFLATTSHEIRTPLNGILGMTQVLLTDASLDPAVRERIEVVNSAGETMRTLVDDILDLAKIESGNLTLQRGDFNLQSMVVGVARLWQDQCSARGLDFQVDLTRAPKWINEDQCRLRQVLFNLLSNAVKFTHHGRIVLLVERDDDRLKIIVKDTGIGIDEEDLGQIFENFRQVDSGITRRYGGTGLGLSISQRLANAMGGDVQVRSCLGEGSTFTLTLPLRERWRGRPVNQPEVGAPDSLKSAGLLIVEPNPVLQRAIAAALGPYVGSTSCAANASEALKRISEEPPVHHVVADITKTPDMRALAEATKRQRIKLSLLYDTQAASADMLKLGASQVIPKPITGSNLATALAANYQSPGVDPAGKVQQASAA